MENGVVVDNFVEYKGTIEGWYFVQFWSLNDFFEGQDDPLY